MCTKINGLRRVPQSLCAKFAHSHKLVTKLYSMAILKNRVRNKTAALTEPYNF